jgi:hypothetical protein
MLVLFLSLVITSTPSDASEFCESYTIPLSLVRLVSNYHHVRIIGAASGERAPIMLPQAY